LWGSGRGQRPGQHSGILSNATGLLGGNDILDSHSGILSNFGGVLNPAEGILNGQGGILNSQEGILNPVTSVGGILNHQSGTLGYVGDVLDTNANAMNLVNTAISPITTTVGPITGGQRAARPRHGLTAQSPTTSVLTQASHVLNPVVATSVADDLTSSLSNVTASPMASVAPHVLSDQDAPLLDVLHSQNAPLVPVMTTIGADHIVNPGQRAGVRRSPARRPIRSPRWRRLRSRWRPTPSTRSPRRAPGDVADHLAHLTATPSVDAPHALEHDAVHAAGTLSPTTDVTTQRVDDAQHLVHVL